MDEVVLLQSYRVHAVHMAETLHQGGNRYWQDSKDIHQQQNILYLWERAMSVQFMPMGNQCDILPRLTVVVPWGPVKCGFIYLGFLWWMIAIRWGDMPYSNE